MGIAERDYARNTTSGRPPGGGGAMRSMRMWSVNTWLIVICVGVFVIDGLLPEQPVVMKTLWVEAVTEVPDESSLVAGPEIDLVTRRGKKFSARRPLHLGSASGPVIGVQEIRYMQPLEKYLHFSTQRGFFQVHFWRLVGFQFLHSHDTIMHLLFNMIGLYFFGGMVERYLGSKRYLAFYLLCGICGALMYTVLNIGGYAATEFFNLQRPIPGLLFNDFNTPLIGASAGVFGVLMAGAYLAPNATVLMFFIIPMKLRTLAYVIVAMALFTIISGGSNAGGEAGHLGGAIAGFYFIRRPHHLHGFFDFLGWADPTSHHYRTGREGPARARAIARQRTGSTDRTRAEVDRILDKVNERGLASLTDREKRILQKASER